MASAPAESNIGKAARAVADVFGCSVEEAESVPTLGIDAPIAEQNARRAEQEQRRKQEGGRD